MLSQLLSWPHRFVASTVHLFSAPKFRIHRVWGLVYLFYWAATVWSHISGNIKPALFWMLPIAGFIQTLIACRTFTFLPRADEKTQGYYHEKKAMSYAFIVENIYFSGLLLFQSLYLSFDGMRTNPLFLPIELIGVFFPYHTVRPLFPKSSFRHSIKDGNRYAMVVKVFYCIAKHMSGFYVNYLQFLGKFGPNPVRDYSLIRNLLILGGWGTTIAMFLQTLKFKHYISPTTAMILYAGSFPFFYACYAALVVVAFQHVSITTLALVGLAVNFAPPRAQIVWQCLVAAVCVATRYEFFPASVQAMF